MNSHKQHAHEETRPDACGRTACGHAHSHDAPDTPATDAAPLPPGLAMFRIGTMDCSAEEGEIRRALEPLAGVRGLRFALGARTLGVDADAADLPAILAAIRKAGFDPQPLGASAAPPQRSPTLRLAAALLLAIGAELTALLAPDLPLWRAAGMALALLAIGLSGLETYQKGLAALRQGRLNINALMAVAVTGAFVIGQWPEAAMVMALYAIAELIEARAVDRTRNAIKGLLALAPAQAEALQADGSWQRVATVDVSVGTQLRIKPGERIPLDGLVTAGRSAVDQSSVTGESLPVDKALGDSVFAGTINQSGALEIRVSASAQDSTLARIIESVEQAQSTRAPMQRWVDRFAAVYTPAVFAVAVAVAVLSPMLTGLSWLEAIYKALVLLVIACPCALVISTPVSVVSALAAAARRGVLIKGGSHLEQARRIKVVALDKTGTLTEGRPVLVAWQPVGEASDFQLGSLALSLAARSDHPVSQAIAAGLVGEPQAVQAFEALAGFGVQGQIDGALYTLAKHRLMHERGLCSAALEARLAVHEAAGRSVTLLADASRVLALFAVADRLKPSSAQAVAELQGLGVRVVMLSGDNARAAAAMAAQAGIAEVHGDLLPQDKQAAISRLQREHGPTAMVGDGINDAPSLAQADLGFAMGAAGTHVAMEAADVLIMNDDLRRIGQTIRLSRHTQAVLWQNVSLALGLKAAFLLLAVFGHASMWMAVFADMGASLLVVANGLRLLRVKS